LVFQISRDHVRVANADPTSAQSVCCSVNYLCPRWRAVQREASAEINEWQHTVAIRGSVVAYGQFDAPNEERAHMTLDLTPDQLLSTTRTVRKRLDLSRPVERELLEECFDLAFQAPTGGNQQGWHFVVVTDADQKKALAELYRKSQSETEPPSAPPGQQAVMKSAAYLAEHLQEVPVLVIPCIEGRYENAPPLWQAIAWASILPATWSFMLAARARGLGTAWTSLHLAHERDAAAVLGIPYEQVTQAALIPVAHTIGTQFRPGPRSPQAEHIHWGRFTS
jgi:nitroreductase